MILEFDKRGGMFSGGHDSFGRYTVDHATADTIDWTQQVDAWVRQAVEHRQHPGGYSAPGYGHGGYHDEHHGSGMGGVAMGVAGGLAAGYVAGEIIDEVFEEDEEEEVED